MAESPRKNTEWRLIEKAWKDEEFRRSLLSDPAGTVSRELGIALPPGVEVKVLEETSDTFVLVIPARPDSAGSGKLSAAELDQVAGGWDFTISACQTCGCQRETNRAGC